MKLFVALFAGALALSPAFAENTDVRVMIVGTFHMSNPGKDMHNVTVDDVLAPKRQGEIAAVASSLATFKPTAVAVEWPSDITEQRYELYRRGKLPPSRNEVVQLGFRLAKSSKLERVHGIDVDGDFPYGPVDAFAKAHGQSAILENANAEIGAFVAEQQERLARGSIGSVLRWLNDPSLIARGNSFYRMTLRIGAGSEQPGAHLLTAWYRRNFLICANLIQMSKPGDRIVVFYGSGHSFLLRQCIEETPGFELVEANDYLRE